SVAADALSKNKQAKPLRVRALVMTINSNRPLKIHEARVEALKKETVKDENFHGMDKEFKNHLDETLCIMRRRTIVYRIELLEQLSKVHSTLHVSNLKKCLADEPLAIPLDEIQVDDKLHFIEEPVDIMDHEVKRLKQSRIPIVKVRWNSRRGLEFTCSRCYVVNFEDKDLLTRKGSSVAADALSKNEQAKPLRVRALVMTINSNRPLEIHEARVEALKKKTFKDENFHGMDKEFKNHLDETLCIRRRRTIVYRLELLDQLSKVHSTLHVSNLKKCLADEPLAIPLDEIQVDDKLHFIEEPVEIMDHEVKRLKQSRIPIVKVRWNSRRGLEFTCSRCYVVSFEDKALLTRKGCDTS
nr:putative reverse transcriptase domain-containing protein [Tanacetum cinerariifolium]